MIHPFEWRRSPAKDLQTRIKQMAEKKFPGNKHGKFIISDGRLAEKTPNGEIKILRSKNQSRITL